MNGELRQHSNTRHLIFDCFAQVEHLSTAFTLEPGDVVTTGTPSGVGGAMNPPRFLRPGDVVRIEIEKDRIDREPRDRGAGGNGEPDMTTQEDRHAKLAPDRGRIAPTKLAHIVRRTSRFDEMLRWYQTVLGAAVVHSDGILAFLSYDDEHHRIAIAGIPGLEDQPPLAAGTDHVAFTHADLGDLLCTYARLKREDIEPCWCINHGPTTSMYYKDPDGNRIELQVDNFPTTEETNRWIRSGEFAANPIGVVFDPQDLLARYRAGEPIEQLSARPPLPAGATPFDMLRL